MKNVIRGGLIALAASVLGNLIYEAVRGERALVIVRNRRRGPKKFHAPQPKKKQPPKIPQPESSKKRPVHGEKPSRSAA